MSRSPIHTRSRYSYQHAPQPAAAAPPPPPTTTADTDQLRSPTPEPEQHWTDQLQTASSPVDTRPGQQQVYETPYVGEHLKFTAGQVGDPGVADFVGFSAGDWVDTEGIGYK